MSFTSIWQTFPSLVNEFCVARSRFHFSIHACPCCGYSLRETREDESGLTTCSECGIGWSFPEMTKIPPARDYHRRFIGAGLLIFLFVVYLGWSMAYGVSAGASRLDVIYREARHLIIIGLMGLGIWALLLRWAMNTVMQSGPVVPMWTRDQNDGSCPACAALAKDVATDSKGMRTCWECEARWCLPGEEG